MNPSLKARLREMEQLDAGNQQQPTQHVERQPSAEILPFDETVSGLESQPTQDEAPNAGESNGQPTDTDSTQDAKHILDNEALRKEVELLKASNEYLNHRWNSYAGMHKAQVTNKAHENEELKAEIAELKSRLESIPQTSVIENTLKKRFGEDVWDRIDEDEKQRWIRTEEAHEADRSAMRKSVESTRAPAANERQDRFWSKVEEKRPGFRAAMLDDLTGMPIFLDSENADSADGLTYRKCIDVAASVGNVQAVIAIADLFTTLDGRKFDGSSSKGNIITPNPQTVTPANTNSVQPSTERNPAVTAKPKFPKAWATQFSKEALKVEIEWRSKHRFLPFKFKLGDFERTFKTMADVKKMQVAVEDAELDDRLY